MRHERDADDFRCLDCEAPIRRGRFCSTCRPERLDDDLGQTIVRILDPLVDPLTHVCRECGGTPRTDHRLWCSGRRI